MMQTRFAFEIPGTAAGERPVEYADRVGGWYVAQRDDAWRKAMGLYLTPIAVADFMASTLGIRRARLRILDPAAGTGILLCAAVEHLANLPEPPDEIELVAYELDGGLIEPLRAVLQRLKAWAAKRGIRLALHVRHEDFILAHAGALEGHEFEPFDAVIANPPYFKIAKNDPRAIAAQAVVHGQPNIYGLFMAVSAALLDDGGEFLFITPRSFSSGPYFRQFRERFFEMMRPCRVHLFDSRRMAFSRDDVLQENVILQAIRDEGWLRRKYSSSRFTISKSAGLADLAHASRRSVKLASAFDKGDAHCILRLPASLADEKVLRRVGKWKGSLQEYGLRISTGPVVPFRATQWLAEKGNGATVPLLWMNHVRAMDVHWPNGIRKPQHIVCESESRKLLLPNRNYVVLRRFSAKEEQRRLTAAPLLARHFDAALIGLENHLNYIHRPEGNLTEEEAWGLAAFFNSVLFDEYFRCLSGNTQVSATELRAMPLPPLETIVAIGKRLKGAENSLTQIDELVEQMIADEPSLLLNQGERAIG